MAKSTTEITDPSALSYLELFLVVHVCVMIAITSIGYAFDSRLAHTAVLVWSLLALVIMLLDWGRHRRNEKGALVLRIVSVLPIVYFVTADLLGRSNPAFSVLAHEEDPLLLQNFNPFRPVNGAPEVSLGKVALYSGLFLTVLNVLWVAKRRRVLRPILLFGALNASFLAFLGLLQEIIHLQDKTNTFATRMLFITPAPNPFNLEERVSFFSSFAHSNHWTIFAALWVAALGAHLSFPIVTPHGDPPANRFRWLLRPLFIPLLASAWIASPILFLSLVLLIIGSYWIELARYLSKFTGGKATPHGRVLFFSTIGLVALGGGLFYGVATLLRSTETYLMRSPDAMVPNLDALVSDGWKMLQASPLFGWGPGSYPSVHALFKQDDLFLVHHLSFPNTWMAILIETGWVGLAMIIAFPLTLVVVYMRQHYGNALGNVLLISSLLVLLIGFMENLVAHPALCFSVGLLLVIGFRHGQIGNIRRDSWDFGEAAPRSPGKIRSGRRRRSSSADPVENPVPAPVEETGKSS